MKLLHPAVLLCLYWGAIIGLTALWRQHGTPVALVCAMVVVTWVPVTIGALMFAWVPYSAANRKKKS